MTIIAAIKISETPVLIGDILISRTGIEQPHIEIPTIDDVNLILPEEWQRNVCGLYPKLVLINSSLTIAWTGHVIAARSLIEEIRGKFGGVDFVPDELFFFLKNDESIDTSLELTIIGWVIVNGKPISFHWNSEERNKVNLNGEYVEGSGAVQFKDHVSKQESIHGPINSIDSACLGALGLIGSMLTEEFYSGNSIEQLYGGGYQIIVFDKGKFVFIDDYIVIPLQCQEKKTKTGVDLIFNVPVYVYKHKYFKNQFFINRIKTDRRVEGANKTFFVGDMHYYDNKPLSVGESKYISSLQANYYCCFPFLIGPDGTTLCQNFVVPSTDKYWIYLEKNSIKENIKFHDRFLQVIAKTFLEQKKNIVF
jgi:hypothetical protein